MKDRSRVPKKSSKRGTYRAEIRASHARVDAQQGPVDAPHGRVDSLKFNFWRAMNSNLLQYCYSASPKKCSPNSSSSLRLLHWAHNEQKIMLFHPLKHWRSFFDVTRVRLYECDCLCAPPSYRILWAHWRLVHTHKSRPVLWILLDPRNSSTNSNMT